MPVVNVLLSINNVLLSLHILEYPLENDRIFAHFEVFVR